MTDLNEIFEKAKKEEIEKMAELERLTQKEQPIVSVTQSSETK